MYLAQACTPTNRYHQYFLDLDKPRRVENSEPSKRPRTSLQYIAPAPKAWQPVIISKSFFNDGDRVGLRSSCVLEMQVLRENRDAILRARSLRISLEKIDTQFFQMFGHKS